MAHEKHLFHPKNLAFVCSQYSTPCRRLQLVGAIIDRSYILYIGKEHPLWGAPFAISSCKDFRYRAGGNFSSGRTKHESAGAPSPSLAAAAAVVAAVIVGVAAAIATAIAAATAAIAEDQQQNDDPPPVVPTEAAAQTVIVAHKITSGFNR